LEPIDRDASRQTRPAAVRRVVESRLMRNAGDFRGLIAVSNRRGSSGNHVYGSCL